MKRRWVLVILLFVLLALLLPIGLFIFFPAPIPRGELALQPVYEGLAFPVSLAFAPDGRLFYNELQAGRVRVIEDGAVREAPFVTLNVAAFGEAGLLGLALDPDYATSPYVYVYYTYESDGVFFNRVSRLREVNGVAGSEEVILDGLRANSFHNSGRLRFGPDGMLYVSVGDAGVREDSQDLASLQGKILRMRSDGAIPADNPFPNSLVYALGIRNVFGLGFRGDGSLIFTENGPSGNDEVNIGVAGGNYGWPEVQGVAMHPRFEDPILVFAPFAIAPTGVAFYSGSGLGPDYADTTFFTSWNDGGLRTIREEDGGFRADLELTHGNRGLLDVAMGPDGALYVSSTEAILQAFLVPLETPEGMALLSPLAQPRPRMAPPEILKAA